MDALHPWMVDELATVGARIDAFEYCPDHPEGIIERYRRDSDRRKPGPDMITDLMKRFPVAADRSILIGDQQRGLDARAHAAGHPGPLVSGGQSCGFSARGIEFA